MATNDLRRRLVELDAQIAAQQCVVLELQQVRAAIDRELRATAIYPAVSTLPAEIAAEIFAQCISRVDLHQRPEDAPTSTPFVLMGVCRAWKEITLSTPLLWSTMHLRWNEFPRWISSEPGLLEEFIDRWFGRAGVCPLSFILHASREDSDGAIQPPTAGRMHDVIRRYSHRIYYLELDMNELEIRHLELDSMEFPLLQIATFGYDRSWQDTEPPLQIFTRAPLWNDLRMRSGAAISDFSFPWSQLTKYEGVIWDMDMFILAPNLIEVACDLFAQDPWTTPVITHPNLRRLSITHSGSDDILRRLSLPGLQSLDISNVDQDSSLELFLMRSSPPLLSLCLHGDNSCFDEWHRWTYQVGGTLENLRLKCPSREILSTIFDPFTTKNLHSLPNLRTLRFDYAPGNLNYAQITRFLYSRSDKIRSFQLTWNVRGPESRLGAAPWSETVAGELSRMIKGGMHIYLGTKEKNYAAIDEWASRS
ncbi:hypothetical protein C8R47DRAFT_1162915 [Mycena vitilis]|nr:hypothetical protein C8R47DRAFT_1162915 [Mycena vitilis]